MRYEIRTLNNKCLQHKIIIVRDVFCKYLQQIYMNWYYIGCLNIPIPENSRDELDVIKSKDGEV